MTSDQKTEEEKIRKTNKQENESGWNEKEPSTEKEQSGWGEPEVKQQKQSSNEANERDEPKRDSDNKDNEERERDDKQEKENGYNAKDNNSWSRNNDRNTGRPFQSARGDQGGFRSEPYNRMDRRGDYQQRDQSWGPRDNRRVGEDYGGNQRFSERGRGGRYDDQNDGAMRRTIPDGDRRPPYDRRSEPYNRNDNFRDDGRMNRDMQQRGDYRRDMGVQRRGYDDDYPAKRRQYEDQDRNPQYNSRYGDDRPSRYGDRDFMPQRNDRDFNGMQNRRDYPPRPRREIPIDPPPSHVLGLFGISHNATEADVQEYVAEHVPNIRYEKLNLIRDKSTGASKGFAFIYYESIEEAITAKKCLVGKFLQGREVRVDYSISSRPRNEAEQ